ncbi:ATP-binding protein [Vulgatibacter sp.]|uniref:hybrid sensor histidine kinase/response regulator n=1 Tax=Vulgatibacter sp. TaxID=1971226 RepID=UPI0035633D36
MSGRTKPDGVGQWELAALADNIAQLAWIADESGWIYWYNRRWLEYTGMGFEEMQGWGWRKVHHPDHVNRVEQRYRTCIESGDAWEDTFPLRRHDGTYRWFLSRAKPIHDESGKVLRWFGTNTDVTRQRETEEALRQSEHRFRELAQALREADRRKDEFIAVLSHELRNPLAPIRNGLYVIQRAPGTEKAERALGIIDRQVSHMAHLIDDLLDLTRISRGKIQLKVDRLELGELVQRIVEDHRDVFDRAGTSLDLVLPDDPIWTSGDANRLTQILGNILQNAARFTGSGGSTTVSLARGAEGWSEIRVADTGQGIAPELLPHLFEPFVQADTTLDRRSGGLGLGLALVKGLVEMHGGEVSAESPGVGQGAAFVLRLRVESPGAVEGEPLVAATNQPIPRRILLIEDNVDAAETLRDVLDFEGHQVALTHSGVEGIACAREFRPEVILCDLGLPGMDGFQVATAIRGDPELRDVVLAALSGYALPEDVEKAKQAGFDEHMSKPPDLEALKQLLARTP